MGTDAPLDLEYLHREQRVHQEEEGHCTRGVYLIFAPPHEKDVDSCLPSTNQLCRGFFAKRFNAKKAFSRSFILLFHKPSQT